MGQWKNVGSCTKSCGGGLQNQKRVCDGNYCGSQSSTRTIPCMTEKCPDVWTSWTSWSSCNAQCGGGVRRRERTMLEGSRKVNTICSNL